jgi:hypothetical protein
LSYPAALTRRSSNRAHLRCARGRSRLGHDPTRRDESGERHFDPPLDASRHIGAAISARNWSRSRARHADRPATGRRLVVRGAEPRVDEMRRRDAERRLLDEWVMCAPIDGRNGPVGAHPQGGATRTLAGSVRYCATTIAQRYLTRVRRLAGVSLRVGVYLNCRFPEPQAVPAQPSPKLCCEGATCHLSSRADLLRRPRRPCCPRTLPSR